MTRSALSRVHQAEETRQKLLENALILFSEQGYSKTSIRSLARQAGLSDGLLYHHFPEGKQQILSVLLTQGIQQALQQLSRFNQDLEHAPLAQVLESLCELCVQLFSNHKALLKVILRESESMQLTEIHVIEQLFSTRQAWLATLLQERHRLGEIREMNFMLASQQFMAVNIQYGLTYLLDVQIGCDIANPVQRQAWIEHTLMLWQAPA